MPDDSIDQKAIEQQAVDALAYLNDSDKKKVLEYIDSLVTLDNVNNEQRSPR